MKKVIITVGICIIVIAIVVTSVILQNGKSNNTLKKIRVNEVTRSVFYAPQYIAIKMGFFEEEGLQIDLSTGRRSRHSYDLGSCGAKRYRFCRT